MLFFRTLSGLRVHFLTLTLIVFQTGALVQAETTANALPVNGLPEGVQAVTIVQGVAEYRLDNGLQILLSPDDSSSQTSVNMSYRVGSRHEGPGQSGMAHLLEHLLFRGSPAHPDAMAEFSRRGLAANGSTSVDLTNYYATFAGNDDNLRWYLSWQADAMQNARISQEDLDAEMTVVRNEMERGENSPFSMLLQQLGAAAYVWHPYGRSVIGARSDVENVDIGQLRDFYRMHYQPDNASLIVTGRFDALQVLGWIAADFGSIPRPERTLPAEYTVEPVQQGPRAVWLHRQGGSPLAIVQYHLPSALSDDFVALDIGSAMLADTPSGPLYETLVESGQASSVFGFARAMNKPGHAIFGAQLQPGTEPDSALATLTDTLENSGIGRLDQAALDRLRTAWLNQWNQTWNRPASLAHALSSAVSLGDWRLFFINRMRVEALDLDTVASRLQAWLLPNNRTTGIYLPTEAPAYAPENPRADLTPWLDKLETGTTRPSVAAFDTSPQAIDQATRRSILTLANGPIELALLPKETAGRQVHAYMRLHFGNVDQLHGLGLVPAASAAMLMRGTHTMSRQQIDDRLNELDADLGFSSQGNMLTVSMRSAREQLPELIELAFHILREPSFPEGELAQIQRSIRTRVENDLASPGFLVNNTLQRHGQPWKKDDIRYVASPEETLQWSAELTPQRLQDFHARFYGAGEISMAVVGDFDPLTLEQSLRKGLEGWRSAPPYVRIAEPWYPVEPREFHIPAPGKANANFLATMPLQLQDTHPAWPALMLGNYLLGGSEDSRLWQRVRARDGLSYGVGSGLQASAWEPSGSWTLFASMAPENSDALQKAIGETIDDTLRTGFTQEEVDQGVRSLVNFLQLGRSNDAWLASRWLDYLDTGRSFAWQQHIQDQLLGLTASQVNQAMREFLNPAGLSIAIAAEPQPLKPAALP